jgi:hypothetical protein
VQEEIPASGGAVIALVLTIDFSIVHRALDRGSRTPKVAELNQARASSSQSHGQFKPGSFYREPEPTINGKKFQAISAHELTIREQCALRVITGSW